MPISALPDLCYELSNGTDAAGNGPSLTGGTYGAGLLGNALDSGATAAATAEPGIDLSGDFTVNFWLNIVNLGFEDALANIVLNKNGAWGYTFNLYANDSGGINIYFTDNSGPFHTVDNPGTGWKMFSAVRTAGSCQLYFQGSAVGTPDIVGNVNQGSDLTSIENLAGGGGRLDQLLARGAAYSAGDITYLYNGGSGIAFASMSAGGGAGAGSAVARFRRRHLMLEGSSWSMQ